MKHFAAVLPALAVTVVVAAQQPDIGASPGRLIDVGGRRLHLLCTGAGSPTVILEAGASSFAIDWSLVQPEIAKAQRVCSYDRAGSGWSDPRTDVETSSRIVADLHTALVAAGERPPFVMAGASAGAVYVRLYQLEHPKEVAGLVLVDPGTETRLFAMFQQRPVLIASLSADELRSTLPAAGPVPVPTRQPQVGVPFDRLPPDLYRRRIDIDRRLIQSFPASVSLDVIREFSEGQRVGLARLAASRNDPDNPIRSVPLVVLTRGEDASDALIEAHAEVARLSKNSRHTVVRGAGHEIHLYTPTAVIEALQDVREWVTRSAPLRDRPRP